MKLSLSSFRINRLNKENKNIVLINIFVIFIGYLLYKTFFITKEGMRSEKSKATTKVVSGLSKQVQYGMDKVSYLDDKVSSGLDSVVDFLSEKKEIPPQWRDFYGDGEMGETDVYKELQDTSTIINDTCSTKGFLYSDYKDDICEKYGRNPSELDEKCKNLSVTNCKIPSCCVLLNGKQCRAGNIHGPLFLTDKGKDIDFSFYHNKQRCYGLCDISFNPLEKCDKYLHNSVGISKECMVQM